MRRIRVQLLLGLVLVFVCACFAGEYTVKSGDTLSSIAKNELGSAGRWKEIAELNDLSEPYTVRIGQVLKMPGDSGDDEAIADELEELIKSSENHDTEKEESADKGGWKLIEKLLGGKKVKVVWFLPAIGIGLIILFIVIMLLISTVCLLISAKLMGIKGRFGKCFLIVIATQGPCFIIKHYFPPTFNPFVNNPWTILAGFYGTIFLFCLIHIFLIKVLLDCKTSKAIASFCLMISLTLFSYMVIYLVLVGVILGSFAAAM